MSSPCGGDPKLVTDLTGRPVFINTVKIVFQQSDKYVPATAESASFASLRSAIRLRTRRTLRRLLFRRPRDGLSEVDKDHTKYVLTGGDGERYINGTLALQQNVSQFVSATA